jgi:hypothetical protein
MKKQPSSTMFHHPEAGPTLALNSRANLDNLLSSVGVFSPDYDVTCERTDIVNHLPLMVSDLMSGVTVGGMSVVMMTPLQDSTSASLQGGTLAYQQWHK